jgi:hypothetical protein
MKSHRRGGRGKAMEITDPNDHLLHILTQIMLQPDHERPLVLLPGNVHPMLNHNCSIIIKIDLGLHRLCFKVVGPHGSAVARVIAPQMILYRSSPTKHLHQEMYALMILRIKPGNARMLRIFPKHIL